MKKKLVLQSALCLILLFISIEALAQHNFKFSQPKTLVPSGQNPEHPDIAWDGHNFAVVYDNYYYNNKSSDVFLILVNTNGDVVEGPVKISSKKHALHPKIVWTGNAYGILYAAGQKQGNILQLKMYLARYNAAGKKLGEKALVGDLDSQWSAGMTKLIWTGKKFGIFYAADTEKRYSYCSEKPLFCNADSSGTPGEVLQTYRYSVENFDVTWDGKQYIAVSSDLYSGWRSEAVLQVLALDDEGAVTKSKAVIGFVPMDYCRGASIIPLKKKNRYLIAIGNVKPTETAAPSATLKTGDVFASQIKLKKKSVSGLAPKNITAHEPENWVNPTLIRAGNNQYMVSHCGAGCSFAFAKLNDSGAIASTPLQYNPGA